MRNKPFLTVAALCCALALFAGACSKSDEAAEDKRAEGTTTTAKEQSSTTTTSAPADAEDNTVVDVIVADDDLSQVAGLITEAGLEEALSGGGPFTILAPTNQAMSAVPAATLANLEQDPQGALANVLKLHVISGNVTVDDLADEGGQCVDTLGGKVKITVEGEGDDATVSFGGATIEDGDPQTASNGTILKLDSVVTAPATDC
ncbi:fasciclin domain-containing protein [Dermatobacter hominis]|uniref:fasciclin domain-containing protein n=1 Tax=Dermatobacter hominis TaxID=2884263 RepID=UPI001D129A34|nr:fasciclin domain-containing protein [Dermatobacter hominis]UDY36749.1 fasciclin domain-containing protein [Dermatobacter hominis]